MTPSFGVKFGHEGTKTRRFTWCLGALVAKKTWPLRAFVPSWRDFTIMAILSLQFTACTHQENKITRSVYHWKTRFSPSRYENQQLKALGVNKIYIKYFDVDFTPETNEALPQAKVEFSQIPDFEVVPTIFVTNRTLQNVPQKDCHALADKIYRLIFRLHPKELAAPKEIQIDCDWTQNSREAYFTLLKQLKTRLDSTNTQLSATIRLHQLKYPKQTGIPPVDRGTLMFYNMGDLENPAEDNSILNISEGAKYLSNASEYAMPLDVALPIFAWGVLIRRGKPIKLLNNLRQASVQNIPWMTATASNVVRVDSNHYFHGHYLYPGDQIRMEEVTPSAIMEAANLLSEKMNAETRSVILYHLDSLTLSHYRKATLDSVYSTFE